jgi:hypothetical protein
LRQWFIISCSDRARRRSCIARRPPQVERLENEWTIRELAEKIGMPQQRPLPRAFPAFAQLPLSAHCGPLHDEVPSFILHGGYFGAPGRMKLGTLM